MKNTLPQTDTDKLKDKNLFATEAIESTEK
jgi:hypothetical protein